MSIESRLDSILKAPKERKLEDFDRPEQAGMDSDEKDAMFKGKPSWSDFYGRPEEDTRQVEDRTFDTEPEEGTTPLTDITTGRGRVALHYRKDPVNGHYNYYATSGPDKNVVGRLVHAGTSNADLRVHPDWQHNGIGSSMLAEAYKHFDSMGRRWEGPWLVSEGGKKANQRAYEKLGGRLDKLFKEREKPLHDFPELDLPEDSWQGGKPLAEKPKGSKQTKIDDITKELRELVKREDMGDISPPPTTPKIPETPKMPGGKGTSWDAPEMNGPVKNSVSFRDRTAPAWATRQANDPVAHSLPKPNLGMPYEEKFTPGSTGAKLHDKWAQTEKPVPLTNFTGGPKNWMDNIKQDFKNVFADYTVKADLSENHSGAEEAPPFPFEDIPDLRVPDEVAEAAPVKSVRLDSLIATQDWLYRAGVEKYEQNPDAAKGKKNSKGYASDYPYVLDWNGKYYIIDGHHRCSAALENGESSIVVKVIPELQVEWKKDLEKMLDSVLRSL